METATQTIYDDSNVTGIARAGLRQTDLSAQLESSHKKKYRNKTQSVFYNTGMAMSKSSLYDGVSTHSGTSNGTNTNMSNMDMNNMNSQRQQYMMQQQHLMKQQQMMMMQQQQQQQQMMMQQQMHNQQQGGYYNNQQNGMHNNQQQQHQQQQQQMYYQNNGSQGNIQVNKQRAGNGKKDYRESYMYLNQFNSKSDIHVNQQTFNGNSPQQNLTRRFSGQNGGVVGSPMSMTNEEAARKISFNNLIGNTSMNHTLNDEDILGTLDYMNNHNLDGTPNTNKNLENEWEYIDEDDEEGYEYKDEEESDEVEDNLSATEMKKMIERMKIENRGLKKKLKDIELGHDASSIVANDEKYIKLEDEYTDLASRHLIIENEVKNMTIQNETYFKDINNLRSELNQSEDKVSQLTSLSRSLIEKVPNYVNQKDHFLVLLGDLDIPDAVKDTYQRSLDKYNDANNTKAIQNSTDGNLTDDDVMKLLKDEVKQLSEALSRQDNLLKQKDKVYNQKIQEERKTIIVSALQKTLRNEFINEDPSNKKFGLKNFKILKICPDSNTNGLNLEPILDSSSPILLPTSSPIQDHSSPTLNIPSSSSANSLTPDRSESRMPYLSPISLPSSTDSSPKKRTTIYSNDEDYRDAFSTISKATHNSLATRNSLATHNSLEIEYETFTS